MRYFNPNITAKELSAAQDELVGNFYSETDYYLECADKINSALNELYTLREAIKLICKENNLKKEDYIKKVNGIPTK